MQKTLLRFFGLTGLCMLFNLHVSGQCAITMTSNPPSFCLGDSVVLSANPQANSLLTTMAAGNSHRGNMFDISATNTVTIQGFSGHPTASTTIEIYYKVGTYVGFQATPSAWTLIGSAAVIAQPSPTPTPIPIPVNLTIPSGQTYAFYITSTNTAISQNYTDGVSVGSVYASDANLTFYEGIGLEYPFGATFSPRIWNGLIHYNLPATTLWGTGATTQAITVSPTTTTSYPVTVSIAGCSPISDTITVSPNPSPNPNLGGDLTLCTNDTATIYAPPNFAGYVWNTGQTGSSVFVYGPGIPPGSYPVAVTVTDNAGCTGYDSINLIMISPPAVNIGPDITACLEDQIQLNAGPGFTSYIWSNGDTTATSQVQGLNLGIGTHPVSVEITGTNGCQNSDTLLLEVFPPPDLDLGANRTICVNHTTQIDAGLGFINYMWSTNEVTSVITVDGAALGVGTHPIAVVVTDTNGCSNTDTLMVIVEPCTGMEEQANASFRLFPNPANDQVYIELFNMQDAQWTAQVTDLTGKKLLKKTGGFQSGPVRLDVSGLAAGVYLVMINSGAIQEQRRLIIH